MNQWTMPLIDALRLALFRAGVSRCKHVERAEPYSIEFYVDALWKDCPWDSVHYLFEGRIDDLVQHCVKHHFRKNNRLRVQLEYQPDQFRIRVRLSLSRGPL